MKNANIRNSIRKILPLGIAQRYSEYTSEKGNFHFFKFSHLELLIYLSVLKFARCM